MNKTEFLDMYKISIDETSKMMKESYINIFSTLDQRTLNELYMTYYAKEFMNATFVYFIHNEVTNLIKIGKSNDPFKRLKDLNSMFYNHFGIKDSLRMLRIIFVPSGKSYKVEKMFHEKYLKYKVHGEWFCIDPEEIMESLPEFISHDTDGFLLNEGFEQIHFSLPSNFEFDMFTLDSISEIILKYANYDKKLALYVKKYIADKIIYPKYNQTYYKFLNTFDVRTWSSLFSSNTQNKTWEMYKWIYLNSNTYSLSSFCHLDKNEKITKKVIGFKKNTEVLDYFVLVDNIINNSCYII